MRYAIEALVELLDLGVIKGYIGTSWTAHPVSSLQSIPVLQATKSKPHEYGGYLVDLGTAQDPVLIRLES